MNEAQPSLLELCDHARQSCLLNALIPQRWHWGLDMIEQWLKAHEYKGNFQIVRGEKITTFQGLPVYPMANLSVTGVACVGKKPYVSLLEKSE